MSKREIEAQQDMLSTVRLYCCYHPKDELYMNELEEHLAALTRQRKLAVWDNRKMLAGVVQEREMDVCLSSSDIILLLTSRYFFSSNLYWKLMERALELHRAGRTYIIPVNARPYDYEETPIGDLQILPRKKPLSRLLNRDEGYVEVVEGIRAVMQNLTRHRLNAEDGIMNVAYKQSCEAVSL